MFSFILTFAAIVFIISFIICLFMSEVSFLQKAGFSLILSCMALLFAGILSAVVGAICCHSKSLEVVKIPIETRQLVSVNNNTYVSRKVSPQGDSYHYIYEIENNTYETKRLISKYVYFNDNDGESYLKIIEVYPRDELLKWIAGPIRNEYYFYIPKSAIKF